MRHIDAGRTLCRDSCRLHPGAEGLGGLGCQRSAPRVHGSGFRVQPLRDDALATSVGDLALALRQSDRHSVIVRLVPSSFRGVDVQELAARADPAHRGVHLQFHPTAGRQALRPNRKAAIEG